MALGKQAKILSDKVRAVLAEFETDATRLISTSGWRRLSADRTDGMTALFVEPLLCCPSPIPASSLSMDAS
jgi:hypothetical protein